MEVQEKNKHFIRTLKTSNGTVKLLLTLKRRKKHIQMTEKEIQYIYVFLQLKRIDVSDSFFPALQVST